VEARIDNAAGKHNLKPRIWRLLYQIQVTATVEQCENCRIKYRQSKVWQCRCVKKSQDVEAQDMEVTVSNTSNRVVCLR